MSLAIHILSTPWKVNSYLRLGYTCTLRREDRLHHQREHRRSAAGSSTGGALLAWAGGEKVIELVKPQSVNHRKAVLQQRRQWLCVLCSPGEEPRLRLASYTGFPTNARHFVWYKATLHLHETEHCSVWLAHAYTRLNTAAFGLLTLAPQCAAFT